MMFELLNTRQKCTTILLFAIALLATISLFGSLEGIAFLFDIAPFMAFMNIISTLLLIAGAVVAGIGLIKEEHTEFVAYGLSGIAASKLLQFFIGFSKIDLNTDYGVSRSLPGNSLFYYTEYSYSFYSGSSYTLRFSFPLFLCALLFLAAVVFFVIYAFYYQTLPGSNINNKLRMYDYEMSRFWLAPPIAMAVALVVASIVGIFLILDSSWRGLTEHLNLINLSLIAVSVLLCIEWKYPNGLPVRTPTVAQASGSFSYLAYTSLLRYILLSVFTFGIWPLIWVYRITNELNCVPGFEYRSPVKKLLLFIFVPYYMIYWYYQSALRVDAAAKNKQVPSDIAVLSLAFAFFFPFGAGLLIQGKLNEIFLKK